MQKEWPQLTVIGSASTPKQMPHVMIGFCDVGLVARCIVQRILQANVATKGSWTFQQGTAFGMWVKPWSRRGDSQLERVQPGIRHKLKSGAHGLIGHSGPR
jgi:hypothetical protein